VSGSGPKKTMRPTWHGVILTLFLATLPCYAAAQQTVADVGKLSSDAVVQIVISDSNGQDTALGNGFLISSRMKVAND
jgi:hypothetical protein